MAERSSDNDDGAFFSDRAAKKHTKKFEPLSTFIFHCMWRLEVHRHTAAIKHRPHAPKVTKIAIPRDQSDATDVRKVMFIIPVRRMRSWAAICRKVVGEAPDGAPGFPNSTDI